MPLACVFQICAAVVFKLGELLDYVSTFEVHIELIDIPESHI